MSSCKVSTLQFRVTRLVTQAYLYFQWYYDNILRSRGIDKSFLHSDRFFEAYSDLTIPYKKGTFKITKNEFAHVKITAL